MEALSGPLDVNRGNVLRQKAVKGGAQLLGRQVMGQADAGGLAQGMDPGVGASRAVDLHRDPGQVGEGLLQPALDGVGGFALFCQPS